MPARSRGWGREGGGLGGTPTGKEMPPAQPCRDGDRHLLGWQTRVRGRGTLGGNPTPTLWKIPRWLSPARSPAAGSHPLSPRLLPRTDGAALLLRLIPYIQLRFRTLHALRPLPRPPSSLALPGGERTNDCTALG